MIGVTAMGALWLVILIETVVIVHQYARLWQRDKDVLFWRRLYQSQVDYAARADQQLREADEARALMLRTIYQMRKDLGAGDEPPERRQRPHKDVGENKP